MHLPTRRLILRDWRDDDLPAFAALNADSRVMQFMPARLTRQQSDELADRIRHGIRDHGFGLWAVEIPRVSDFAGFVGLSIPRFEAAFTPCVEVGWRLAAEHWKQGYATEGAQAVVTWGFRQLQLPEIVSFTVPHNLASRRVMEKLGMNHDPADDFDHPLLDQGHPLRRHVLYRISRTTLLPKPQSELPAGDPG